MRTKSLFVQLDTHLHEGSYELLLPDKLKLKPKDMLTSHVTAIRTSCKMVSLESHTCWLTLRRIFMVALLSIVFTKCDGCWSFNGDIMGMYCYKVHGYNATGIIPALKMQIDLP